MAWSVPTVNLLDTFLFLQLRSGEELLGWSELSPEDQRHEYAAANTSIKHVEYRIFKQDAANPALYEYYLQRLKLKQFEMKAKVAEKLAQKGEKVHAAMRDTKMGF